MLSNQRDRLLPTPTIENSSLPEGSDNTPLPSITNPETTSTPSEEYPKVIPPDVTQYRDLSLLSLPEWLSDPNVLWSNSNGTKSNTPTGIRIPLGTSLITDELRAKMSGNDSEAVYAVTVDFSSGVTLSELSKFEYKGKTIAFLEKELAGLYSSGKVIDTRKITFYDGATGEKVTHEIKIYDNDENQGTSAEINEQKQASFLSVLKNIGKASSNGTRNIQRKRRSQNRKYLFYNFATKLQLENSFANHERSCSTCASGSN